MSSTVELSSGLLATEKATLESQLIAQASAGIPWLDGAE